MKIFRKVLIILLLILLVGCEQSFKPINLDEGEKNEGGNYTSKQEHEDGFTDKEISQMQEYFGFSIPFIDGANYLIIDEFNDLNTYNVTFTNVGDHGFSSYKTLIGRLANFKNDYTLSGIHFYEYQYGKNVIILLSNISTAVNNQTVNSINVTLSYYEEVIDIDDFTDKEKQEMQNLFGFVLPFMENHNYVVENYYAIMNAYYVTFIDVDGNVAGHYNDELSKMFIWYGHQSDTHYEEEYYRYGDFIIIWKYSGGIELTIAIKKNEPVVNNDFSGTDKQTMIKYFGFVLPYANGLEYEVEDTFDEDGYYGIYFLDALETDFNSYLSTIEFTYQIEDVSCCDGIWWYTYNYQGKYLIDIAYYETELESGYSYIIDIYIYVKPSLDELSNILEEEIGFVIPLMDSSYEFHYDNYLNSYYGYFKYYVCDVTQTEFNNYKALFDSAYGTPSINTDSDGITWYCYNKDDVDIELAYYECEMDDTTPYIADVYIYLDNGSIIEDDEEVGLPEGTDGKYDVDFTKATTFKDVHDLTDYEYSSPTVGDITALVIPVQFSDCLASSKGYSIQAIKDAFLKNSETNATLEYYSVSDYFYKSSYGKLDITFDVLDEWYTCKNNVRYYENKYDEEGCQIGEQLIIDEFLRAYDDKMDFSKYDSDNDGCIDAIVLINTLEIDADDDENYFHWAFEYSNFYTDDDGYYYEYDGVSANEYLWAAYQFLFETSLGDFDSATPTNTYTFIHEFSHVLGMIDLYDTAYINNPLEDLDMMDASTCDHNPFTKMYYGWITNTTLVTDDVEIALKSFEKTGDTVIFGNNFDPDKGLFQEYYIAVYYTNEELNDNGFGCFDKGVVVYHIDANIAYTLDEYGDYYYLENTNTDYSDENYGSYYNLVEFVKNGDDYTYVKGDTLGNGVIDNYGKALGFDFEIKDMTNDEVIISFIKK